MKMQLSEVARALGIESEDQYDQITITSVSFDSRSLEQGALFVPLIASNDGHEFVEAAKQNGACAALWQKDHENRPQGIPTILWKHYKRLASIIFRKLIRKLLQSPAAMAKRRPRT